ncbi:hypothetical protein J4209_01950 [Candidatus Woesearchaeota archaeon]|nr:hypothetical protein [Candidatus Woesearchaeota archaeon]
MKKTSNEKEEIKAYFCKNCGTIVEENDTKCPKCKNFLSQDRATTSKVITIKEYREGLEKASPSFKLKKWYHYLFYVLGWFNAGNLIFWVTLWIANSRAGVRYDKFFNPRVNKAIFIWGIITIIGYIIVILLIFTVD